MKLAEWIRQHHLTQVEIAHRLDTSQGYVSDLIAGRGWPSRVMAAKIWRLTGGAVTPNDFLEDHEK